jgi:DNA-binding ferritin-like protein
MIHWLAIGNDMEKLHIKAEELYGELDQEIDLLAELIVEKTGTIIDINTIETCDTVGTQNRTFQQGIQCIKQYAQSFIDYIDITYPNQPSDVQSILDDWLRYWNKQINYFITREQEI